MSSIVCSGFYSGMIISIARPEAPQDWLPCNCALVSRSQYPELFDAIQHTYNGGIDPGNNNFKLPDFTNRYPRGASNTVSAGTYDGSANHSHTFNTGLQTNIVSGQNAPVYGGSHGHNFNGTAINLDPGGDHNHSVTFGALSNAAGINQGKVGNTSTPTDHNHAINEAGTADGVAPQGAASNHAHSANIGGVVDGGAHNHNATVSNHEVSITAVNEPINSTVFYFIKT